MLKTRQFIDKHAHRLFLLSWICGGIVLSFLPLPALALVVLAIAFGIVISRLRIAEYARKWERHKSEGVALRPVTVVLIVFGVAAFTGVISLLGIAASRPDTILRRVFVVCAWMSLINLVSGLALIRVRRGVTELD